MNENAKVVFEVKGVGLGGGRAYQALTTQLRELIGFGSANAWNVRLVVPVGTKLSGPLQAQVTAGFLEVWFLP